MRDIKVIKRDGREVRFDIESIKNAIYKAFEDYVASYNEDETNENKINVNIDRIKQLTKNVQTKINQLENEKITVEEIQDLVEKTLISHKETGVYKKFALYRAQRTDRREANSDLMKEIFDITFKDAEEVDAKRDNANVDGNTSMGAMLQYGAAGSKNFCMKHVLKSEHGEAHKNGSIHIHDMDFESIGTLTCLTGDTHITLKDQNSNIINTTIEYFDKVFNEKDNIEPEWNDINNYYILGRNGWTKLEKVMRRKINTNDKLYKLKTHKGLGLKVTENHRIPVIRGGKEELLTVKDINVGDSLLTNPNINTIDSRDTLNLVEEFYNSEYMTEINDLAHIGNTVKFDVNKIKDKILIDSNCYVYDLQTAEHWFIANNYIVHNCCQIDIATLLDSGFSTGHGHLREPQDIMSYAALAAIAIQSNQNDQHGGQSVPNFDYGLAPGVAKTFIKSYKDNLKKAIMLMLNYEENDALEIVNNCVPKYEDSDYPPLDNELYFTNYKSYEYGTLFAHLNNKDKIDDIQRFAYKMAKQETIKKTYQAMEGFLHNLNTMHCLHETQEVYTLSDLKNMDDLKKLSKVERDAFGKLLTKLYEEDKLTIKDISEELCITTKVLNSMFNYFNIQKRNKIENASSIQNRMIKKYGVKNVMQLSYVKDKCITTQKNNNNGKLGFNTDKQKQTIMDKYGVENVMQVKEIKDKCIATQKNNNNGKLGFHTEKAKQVIIEKYGVENVLCKYSPIRKQMKSKDFSDSNTQQKAHDVLKKKYGSSGLGSKIIKKKVEDTNLENYGCKNPGLKITAGKSKWEKNIVSKLKDQFPQANIERNKRSLIDSNKRLEVDIYLPDLKCGIEINGSYSHNKSLYLQDIENNTSISKEMIKYNLLQKQGIKLIHIWEDELINNDNIVFCDLLYKLYKISLENGGNLNAKTN